MSRSIAVYRGVIPPGLLKEIRGEWIMALSGALSILLGVLLVARPTVGFLWIVWMTGAYAIVFGSLLIMLGFQLRRLSKDLAAVISPPDLRSTTGVAHTTQNSAR
jgi:uncharacterized membrane protein HdeD (DUF308 family)